MVDDKCFLVNLNADPALNELLVYYLKVLNIDLLVSHDQKAQEHTCKDAKHFLPFKLLILFFWGGGLRSTHEWVQLTHRTSSFVGWPSRPSTVSST